MSVYTTEITVRFRDIDAMGHVNNAVYGTYVEQARTAYFRDILSADISTTPVVLASLSLDFRQPVLLSDRTVTVSVDVADIGRSSVTMTHEIRTDESNTLVAEAEATLVSLDPASGEPASVPTEHREKMVSYHDL